MKVSTLSCPPVPKFLKTALVCLVAVAPLLSMFLPSEFGLIPSVRSAETSVHCRISTLFGNFPRGGGSIFLEGLGPTTSFDAGLRPLPNSVSGQQQIFRLYQLSDSSPLRHHSSMLFGDCHGQQEKHFHFTANCFSCLSEFVHHQLELRITLF